MYLYFKMDKFNSYNIDRVIIFLILSVYKNDIIELAKGIWAYYNINLYII